MTRLADGLLCLLAVLLAFWLGTLQGRAQGGADERLTAEQRERAVSNQFAQALAAANERNRVTEAALRADLAEQDQSFREAIAHEKTESQRLLAGLRSGAVRLSVPIAAGRPACAGPAGGDPAAAPGDRHEARAELAPQAAADLAAIADDGNAAIVQLNACIDRYNAVRARINALNDAQAQ